MGRDERGSEEEIECGRESGIEWDGVREDRERGERQA